MVHAWAAGTQAAASCRPAATCSSLCVASSSSIFDAALAWASLRDSCKRHVKACRAAASRVSCSQKPSFSRTHQAQKRTAAPNRPFLRTPLGEEWRRPLCAGRLQHCTWSATYCTADRVQHAVHAHVYASCSRAATLQDVAKRIPKCWYHRMQQDCVLAHEWQYFGRARRPHPMGLVALLHGSRQPAGMAGLQAYLRSLGLYLGRRLWPSSRAERRRPLTLCNCHRPPPGRLVPGGGWSAVAVLRRPAPSQQLF